METRIRDARETLLADAAAKDGDRGWKFVDRRANVTMSKKLSDDKATVNSFKGQAIVAFPPRVLAEAIRDVSNLPKWNSQLAYANVIREDPLTDVIILHKVFRTKKCLIDLARDFVYWERQEVLENGTIVVLALSDLAQVEQETVPLPQKCVRGHVYISGWVLDPWELQHGIQGCSATYIAQVDLKELPAAILELAGKEQPLAIKRLEEYLIAKEKEALAATVPNQLSPRGGRFAIEPPSREEKSPKGSPRGLSPRGLSPRSRK
jgi:hypothetical protein